MKIFIDLCKMFHTPIKKLRPYENFVRPSKIFHTPIKNLHPYENYLDPRIKKFRSYKKKFGTRIKNS